MSTYQKPLRQPRSTDNTRRYQRDNKAKSTEKPIPAQSERLQKVLSQQGLGSRRQIEQWIQDGKISVNEQTALLGQKVGEGDRIRLEGRLVNINWRQQQQVPRVLLYHKMEGEIVSRSDPDGRPTVFERLPFLRNGRWIAVGRLDFNSSGLLLFTDSGSLANQLMHPSSEIEREYAVRVVGLLEEEQLNELKQGVQLEDGLAKFSAIVDAGGENTNHWYHVCLLEGKNREVRRMFAAVGLPTISRLIRVRFGNILLPARLKRGMWLEMSEQQVCELAGIKYQPKQSGPRDRGLRADGSVKLNRTRSRYTIKSKPNPKGRS